MLFATAQYKYLVPSISGGFVVIEDVVTVYDAELHDGLTRIVYVASQVKLLEMLKKIH